MRQSTTPLIAFSGIDGAGKSTQIDLLSKALADQREKPFYLWTRGGYTGPFNYLKKIIRSIVFGRNLPAGRTEERIRILRKPWIRTLWLTLAILDLALVYGIYIRWLQWRRFTVIADRYLWDTWIDFTLNFPGVTFDQWSLWKLLEHFSARPDYVFLLLVPVEESLRRSNLKNAPFPDSETTIRERLVLYTALSKKRDWEIIDCTRPINDVAAEILATIFAHGRKA